jgi:tRNA(fMet)-specific endonuclease VapC
MTYLLDTNAVVEHLRSSGQGAISRRLSQLQPGDVAVCSVVRCELMTGLLKSTQQQQNRSNLEAFLRVLPSLPLDDACADKYAEVRAHLESNRISIDAHDLMIAAIAMAHNLTLVTHNRKHFENIPGLRIEDWQMSP